MPDQTAEKKPWWTWVAENPRQAVRLAIILLSCFGCGQWVISEVRSAVPQVKVVDDLMKELSDLKVMVSKPQPQAVMAVKADECKCGPTCPCHR